MTIPDIGRRLPWLVACSVLLAACGGGAGESSDGGLPSTCDRAGAIGPAGGVVEDTDPTSPTAGVRVEVAPGAWKECWEVRVSYAWIFETPDYPAGFVPFERPGPSGSVEIAIGLTTSTGFYRAPDPLPIQISFPMGAIALDTLDIRASYFYDDTQGAWRVVLPQALSPDRLTISTTAHDELWSWGRIDMGEVDFARYVAPAMEGYYGGDTLAAIQAAIDDLRRQALERNFQLTCAGLAAAEGFFVSARDGAASRVQQLQLGLGCGDCNPLTERFQEERDLYLSLNLGFELVSSTVDLIFPPKRAIELALIPLQNVAEDMLLDAFIGTLGLACDYDCYYENVPMALHLNVAMYYGCDWVAKAIDHYSVAYKGCPP
jgi:hypothetical protein